MAPGDDDTDAEHSALARARSGLGTVATGVSRLLPGFIRRNYLLKFALALLLVVAAISIVGASAWASTTDTLNTQISDQLQADADREAQSIAEWRDQRQVWINDLSRVYTGFGTGDSLELSTRLQDDTDTFPDDVRAVHMIDLQTSEIQASSDTGSTGTVLSETDAPWAQQDLTTLFEDSNDVLVSDVYTVSGRQVVAYITEIPQTSNAALVGIVESQAFVTQVPPEQGRFSTVVDTETGDVVMANRLQNEEQVGGEMIGEPYGDDSALEQLTGNSEPTYLGTAPNQGSLDQAYVAATAPVPNTELVVVTHAQEQQVFAVREDIVSQLVLLVMVSLIGLALIGLVIGGGTVRSLKRLTAKANELEDGNLTVELSTSREDEIGQLYASFASMRDSLRDRITQAEDALSQAEEAREDAETARADAEAAREEAQQMNQHLEQKAVEYREVMEACADGDFTRRLDTDSRSDAMEEIGEAFNAMVDDIERIFATVGEFATEVSTASDDLSNSSNELEETSATVSSSIEQISQYTDEQDTRVQNVSQEVQAMSATIEEIAATAENVAKTSKQASDLADEGMEAAEDVVEEMEDIETQAETTLSEIQKLDESMEEIGEIVEVITDIADQTNMLALNANIEAARAGSGGGESGEGFAVVADEVKQLAEETKDSAEQIEDLITSVQAQADSTVEEVRDVQERVVQGARTVEGSLSAFEGISEQVEEADHGVQEINKSTDGIADSVQELAAMSDQVADTSKETAEEANNVAAVTEEQTAAISEVSQNANSLRDQSRTLQELLESFETDTQALDDVDALQMDDTDDWDDDSTPTQSASANGGADTLDAGSGGATDDDSHGEFVFGEDATQSEDIDEEIEDESVDAVTDDHDEKPEDIDDETE
jgi:methyl-accepting chemotaxis protein